MQHNFFQHGVAAFLTFVIFADRSAGRDIRPSDHGLAYQVDAPSPTQTRYAHEMRSFFGSTTSSVPLPEARSIGDESWRTGDGGGGSGDNKRDHVRVGLLTAAGVCGVAGIVLLLVSGIVFVVRHRKQEAEAAVRLSSNSELHAVNDK